MQKMEFFSQVGRLVVRGAIFGIVAAFVFVLSLGAVRMVAAQEGCAFCEVLNKILATADWSNPSGGTVKNTLQLDGVDANRYVQRAEQAQECPENQCIAGIANDGKIICR